MKVEIDTRTKKGKRKAAKLLLIARSLDIPYKALDGKNGKLSDLVRYGIGGPTMSAVKERLE